MISKLAITREPGANYHQCKSDHPLKNLISIGKARRQHRVYREILESLGLEVILLPRVDELPDSCFVEDTAVIHNDKAFITRMALESRRGEEKAIIEFLEENHPIGFAEAPAVIEGGDIVHLEDKLLAGLTQRTNTLGVAQMSDFFKEEVETIQAPEIMHLKSYVNYLGKETIITTEKFAENQRLKDYKKIIVPKTEAYAANVLTINNTIIMAEGFPKTLELVRHAGFEVITIDTGEFRKCDGALTCLSLLI